MEGLDDLLVSHVLSFLDGVNLLTAPSVCKVFWRLTPIATKQRLRRISKARASGGRRCTTIAASKNHTLCLREADAKAYAWGGDTDGDGSIAPLALGKDYGELQTTPCPIVDTHGTSVCGVAAGGYHSLFLTESGQIFIAGTTNLSACADESLRLVRMPKHVLVVQVACGTYHCLALTDDGSLLSWGRDSDTGRLGHGRHFDFYEREQATIWDRNHQVTRPRRVTALDGVHVQEVSAGEDHSLCISAEGGLYSWGDPSFGRLGLPLEMPGTDMSFEDRIAAEMEWGRWCSVPRRVCETVQFTHASAGLQHSLAVSAQGHLYAWGAAKSGQLGNGIDATHDDDDGDDDDEGAAPVRLPTRVEGLSGVAMVAAGAWHSIVLTDAGAVYTFGRGSSGQLCLGDEIPRSRPTRVDSFPASLGVPVEVAAGRLTTFVRFAHGAVLAAGRNLKGELGCGGLAGWDDGEVRSGVFIGRQLPHSARPHCRLTPVAVAWPRVGE